MGVDKLKLHADLSPYQFVFQVIKKFKWLLFFTSITAIIVHMDGVMWPLYFAHLTNTFAEQVNIADRNIEAVFDIAIIGFILWVIDVGGNTLHRYARVNAGPKIAGYVRNLVGAYIIDHSVKFYGDHFSGSISTKANDLAFGTKEVILVLFYSLMPAALKAIILFLIFAQRNILYSILMFTWMASIIAMRLWARKKTEELSALRASAHSRWKGWMTDVGSSIWSVKTYTGEKNEKQNLFKKQRVEEEYAIKFSWFNAHLMAADMFLCTAFCYVGLFTVLGWQWMRGEITPGDWMLIIYGSWQVMYSAWQISDNLPNVLKAIGECQQAIKTLFVPIEITDKANAKRLHVKTGQIEFKNVHFNYNDKTAVFKGKNLIIKGGEKVGLVGPSGAGKTSLVNLILRLFDVDGGAIMIDGQDIRDVTQRSLRQKIAYIPQDPALFHRSLMENIQYGNPKATKKQVYAAARKAQIHSFVMDLEKGYDTLVGERGIKLSGGQRQRVAIARAILKNAPILIVDEGTSALDSVTEGNVQNALYDLMEGRTTIVIAHRLSTLKAMDRLLVMDKGKIIEDGAHLKLLRQKNGLYKKLWDHQVNGFVGA